MISTVYLTEPDLQYPTDPPFYPDSDFPELRRVTNDRTGTNAIHRVLRLLFQASHLDASHQGTTHWNPLGTVIRPGHRVVLKPNWVFDVRGRPEYADQLITHGAFIRAVLDYVVRALDGKGVITICDVPLQSADFKGIIQESGFDAILASYDHLTDLKITYRDLRQEVVFLDPTMSKITGRQSLEGDPLGYTEIDLGADSYLDEVCRTNPKARFAVGDYDENVTNSNQQRGIHRYLIPNTVLDCDVFINLPKFKTHRKAGITGALKNLIGINGSKAYLVHYTRGGTSQGGDEFEKFNPLTALASWTDRRLKPVTPAWIWKGMRSLWRSYKTRAKKQSRAQSRPVGNLLSAGGGWYGNQTIWRTMFDINTILFFADKRGVLRAERQRQYLALMDGIVGCEGDGPLHGTTRHAGTVLLAEDPIAMDVCMAELMGFDPEKIPSLANYRRLNPKWRFSEYNGTLQAIDAGHPSPRLAPFSPPTSWIGHIERS